MERPPDRETLRREGDLWTVIFGGRTCQLRDTVGLRYLSYLLARPHEDVPSLEIRRAVAAPRTGAEPDDHASRERARVNVTRAVKAVLRRLEVHHPVLFEHLSATLRTGARCAYRPDPRIPVRWRVEEL